MKLHLYFARRFLVGFLTAFGALFLIVFLFDLLDQVRKFSSDAGFGTILVLTLLHVPRTVYQTLPLATILGSLLVFLSLSRSSEMVIARAAGRSAIASLAPPVLVAVAIGVTAIAGFNPIVASTSKQYEVLSSRYGATDPSVLSISEEGLWLRQGGAEGQTVIRAARSTLDGTELILTSFFAFGPDGKLIRRIEARRAELLPGRWQIEDAKVWEIARDPNPERTAVRSDALELPTDLTRDQIIDSFGTPSAIPIWQLPGFITQLERAGFSARQHRVWFQMELALPLMLAAMVLVAAGFTLRPARLGQTGLMVVLSITLGLTLYFLRDMAQVLGDSGQIPVALAAWGPATAAALLPMGLLLHLEDG